MAVAAIVIVIAAIVVVVRRRRRWRRWGRRGQCGRRRHRARRRRRRLRGLRLRLRFRLGPRLRLRLRLGGAARGGALRRSLRGLGLRRARGSRRARRRDARGDQARPDGRPASSRPTQSSPPSGLPLVRTVGAESRGSKGHAHLAHDRRKGRDGLRLDDRLARLRPEIGRAAERKDGYADVRRDRNDDAPSGPHRGSTGVSVRNEGAGRRSAARPSASRSAHSELSYAPRLPITTTWKRRTSNSFPQYRQRATLTESPDVTGPSRRVAGRP